MNFIGRAIKIFIPVLGLALSVVNSASADALDDCRNILLSGTYTVKYENVTPPSREAMHEKFAMYSGKVEPPENPYTMYKPVAGIVTTTAGNRYVETNTRLVLPNVTINKAALASSAIGIGGLIAKAVTPDLDNKSEYSTCILTKNNEKFIYTRITNEKKVEYVGHKKGKVEATKIKKGFKGYTPPDFGNYEMSRVLNALLPDDGKVEGTVTYARSGSGTLSNGRYYVDLKAVNPAPNVIFDAIRYYFEGGALVKIEAGQYYKTKTGRLDGTRTIINVIEFSAEAEPKYFKLPEGLQDVTKRDTGAKGATKS